jgi:hypothetical protein
MKARNKMISIQRNYRRQQSANSTKFIIEDSFNNVCFGGKMFDSYEEGWEFIYNRFPVINDENGNRIDDQEDELGEYWVIPNK